MTTETHIISLAGSMLKQFDQSRAPVDVEKILVGLNIEIRRGDLGEETSGVIFRDQGSVFVGVNSTQSKERQRFTLAHELGHHLLHREKNLWVDSKVMFRRADSKTSPEEKEANQFAAELLMPRDLIANENLDSGDTPLPETIKRLANKYRVSAEAMTIRLVTLHLVPQF